jgi:hypothetical protein
MAGAISAVKARLRLAVAIAMEYPLDAAFPVNLSTNDWSTALTSETLVPSCKHLRVAAHDFAVRAAADDDRRSLAQLLAAVAEERDGIAAEPPIDVDELAATWKIDGTLIATAQTAGALVGEIRVDPTWMGFGDIGMMVASVFPNNLAAIALYKKFGFVEEGRLVRHVRRADGQLWDLIEMGLLL